MHVRAMIIIVEDKIYNLKKLLPVQTAADFKYFFSVFNLFRNTGCGKFQGLQIFLALIMHTNMGE